MSEAYIIDACRTARGRRKGSLSNVHPMDLLVAVFNAITARTGVDPKEIEDAVIGCVSETGEQGTNIARGAVLAAGWPVDVPGVTLNRFCGSGQQAVNFAAQAIKAGAQDLVVAGGVENMTRVPMGSDMGPLPMSLMEKYNLVPQGLSAEMIVEKWNYGREEIDRFALASQQKAWRAIQEGRFKKSLIPMKVTLNGEAKLFDTDEHVRPQSTLEGLMALTPSFKPDGKITAGNSSGIVDGAAAVMLASAKKVKELGLKPRARIVDQMIVGSEPVIMLTGPIPATQKVLRRAGLRIGDIDLIEINEAFAPVPLCVIQETGMDPERVNVNGGAIAMGHPLGATGAMLIGTLVDELERQNKRYGLATMCIGIGMGIATIIERL
ncbi:MAG: thiolase family protein [Deltaproteobacteria bacterium]|nr:thiolase family protein [Deltaproteobacteria bacterium]MBI3387049.1 thiolase family protein [Deltaproteobacteria bacterium]